MATESKKAVDLGLLEEDDEFEEFPAESKSKQILKVACVFSSTQNAILYRKVTPLAKFFCEIYRMGS